MTLSPQRQARYGHVAMSIVAALSTFPADHRSGVAHVHTLVHVHLVVLFGMTDGRFVSSSEDDSEHGGSDGERKKLHKPHVRIDSHRPPRSIPGTLIPSHKPSLCYLDSPSSETAVADLGSTERSDARHKSVKSVSVSEAATSATAAAAITVFTPNTSAALRAKSFRGGGFTRGQPFGVALAAVAIMRRARRRFGGTQKLCSASAALAIIDGWNVMAR